MSTILQTDVKIKNAGSGSYGTGYKISISNQEDMCLKIFHNNNDALEDRHGGRIETQIGFLTNSHSNDYVPIHFGRVTNKNQNDGFFVTSWVDEKTPKPANNITSNYSFINHDSGTGHNMTNNGIIYDFGAISVYVNHENITAW